jgi:sirohydrochlorin ferrochelatase
MELAEPSIGEAVAKCAAEGYKKVVIAPYFLSRGRHIITDIPAMVAEAQKAHPEVACVIAEPIGEIFDAQGHTHTHGTRTVPVLSCHQAILPIMHWQVWSL